MTEAQTQKPEINPGVFKALAAMQKFDEAETIEDLWQDFVEYAESLGADLIGYHHFPSDYETNPKGKKIYGKGYPQSWINTYIQKRYIDIDPIIHLSRICSRPYRWFSMEGYAGRCIYT